MEIAIKQSIEPGRAYDLLVSALEGGSNYWYMLESIKEPAPGATSHYKDTLWDKDRAGAKGPGYLHTIEIPFQDGGALIFSDMEGDETKRYTLDYPAIVRGLEIMAEKYPRHWADFVGENDDATTGDVFLQCALFGDVIYG